MRANLDGFKLVKSEGCKGCHYEKQYGKCRDVDCKGFILILKENE